MQLQRLCYKLLKKIFVIGLLIVVIVPHNSEKRDIETKKVQYVLDTKYKVPDKVIPSDYHQIVAYANAVNCKNAILIYPQNLKVPRDTQIGDIRVRSLTFSLDSDLNEAGKTFLTSLLPNTIP